MSDSVISVENLSKSYRIGHQSAERERYVALRDVIGREARNFIRKAGDLVRGRQIVQGDRIEDFWALKNVNFEVKQGEVIGIIGRNGAGKSTLLKILSRITEPTEGRVRLRGRVASLLEVGTGFHPELTGRENIYLNGAILGMSRAEIKRKFAAIVAFADIDAFLDTPVKRYSSGMYVRLAFAVAAHLEPEILVVDEVLAVGDAEFQKKCLGKLDDVSKQGRTILFVSHDMRKVTSLCSRGILLNAGRIEADNDISSVAGAYLHNRVDNEKFIDLSKRKGRSGSGDAQFQSLELTKSGQPCRTFVFGEEFTQKITVNVLRSIGPAAIAAIITSSDGIPVHELINNNENFEWIAERGTFAVTIRINKLNLYPGSYTIDLWMGDKYSNRVDYLIDAATFDVIQNLNSAITRPLERLNGLVFQPSNWGAKKVDTGD